jgi:hypothetical protein
LQDGLSQEGSAVSGELTAVPKIMKKTIGVHLRAVSLPIIRNR